MKELTEVRDAVLSDVPRIRQIYRYYVQETAVTFETVTPSESEFARRMRAVTARYPWLVLERGGTVLGYAYAGPFVGRAAYDWSCELTIYLDRDARGRGWGRQLYEALGDRLTAMGIRNFYACIAWPRAEDDPYLSRSSPDFHAHLGFQQVGHFRRCANKFGHWYDMIWMEKCVGPHEENPAPVRWDPTDISEGDGDLA